MEKEQGSAPAGRGRRLEQVRRRELAPGVAVPARALDPGPPLKVEGPEPRAGRVGRDRRGGAHLQVLKFFTRPPP